jgi:hypothetical protein
VTGGDLCPPPGVGGRSALRGFEGIGCGRQADEHPSRAVRPPDPYDAASVQKPAKRVDGGLQGNSAARGHWRP